MRDAARNPLRLPPPHGARAVARARAVRLGLLAQRALLLAAVALLGGCSLFKRDGPPKTEIEALRVSALDANGNTATELDIVFVTDPAVQALLPKTAPQWFARKQEFLAGYPKAVKVVHLEVPPRYEAFAVTLPQDHDDAIGVTAFANYLAPGGQPAVDLTAFEEAEIQLMNDTVVIKGE